jgi:hypothetical protein
MDLNRLSDHLADNFFVNCKEFHLVLNRDMLNIGCSQIKCIVKQVHPHLLRLFHLLYLFKVIDTDEFTLALALGILRTLLAGLAVQFKIR